MGVDPAAPRIDPEVVRKISRSNRVAVYRTLGALAACAVIAFIVGFLFFKLFDNTSRLDKAICIEIVFLDTLPNSNERTRKLVNDLREVSTDCDKIKSITR